MRSKGYRCKSGIAIFAWRATCNYRPFKKRSYGCCIEHVSQMFLMKVLFFKVLYLTEGSAMRWKQLPNLDYPRKQTQK